jgi:hypothetical protein
MIVWQMEMVTATIMVVPAAETEQEKFVVKEEV